MKFKEFYQDRQLLSEISQSVVDKLPSNVKELLANRRLPFNAIFGDKLRIAEPLKGGKEYKLNITKHLNNSYEMDYDKWVGYKISDKDKKNPVRIGKILSKRKAEFEKLLRETDDEAFKQTYRDAIADLDTLLKTTNLQKQVADTEATSLYVIYSRAPIDVVRMGDMDFKQYSCHSEGGDYFYCALADAMLNAGIAYIISEDDYHNHGFDHDDNLQKDEIFNDPKRSIAGVSALARIRIRLVLDNDGHELAVPTTKIYAKSGYEYNDDFKQQMIKWAKSQDVSEFEWEDTLSLKGGTYEDHTYSIADQIRLIWGKEIRYSSDGEDEVEFREDDDNDDEEEFFDDVVDNLDDKENEEIFEELFGESLDNMGIDIEIRHRNRIKFSYLIPDEIIAKISPEKLQEAITREFDGWLFQQHGGQFRFTSEQDTPALWDFGSVHDGFEYDSYFSECRRLIIDQLDKFSGQGYEDQKDELSFNYRYGFNERTLLIFGVINNTNSDISDATSFMLSQGKDDVILVEEYTLDEFPNIQITQKDIQMNTRGWNTEAHIVLSDLVTAKLKYTVDTISNHIYEKIEEEFPDLLDQRGVDLQITLALPGQNASMAKLSFPAIGDDVRIKVYSSIDKPFVEVIIQCSIDGSDIEIMIDKMTIIDTYDALSTLQGMIEQDKEELCKIDELPKKIASGISRAKHDELKKQGQLELDLNKNNYINRDVAKHKTTFDAVYSGMLLELNLGTGGMSNMSGNVPRQTPQNNIQTNPVGVQGGVDMKFAGNPKFAPSVSTVPGATTQQAAVNNPQQQKPGVQTNVATNPTATPVDPKETAEFTNLLSTRQKNPTRFNTATQQLSQDPERFSRFIDFVTQQIK